MRPGDHISCTLWDILIQQYMSNGNAPTLQSICSCEENCRRTYTDWTAVSPETTETGVADLFYTVLFNGDQLLCVLREESGVAATDAENLAANAVRFQGVNSSAFGYSSGIGS